MSRQKEFVTNTLILTIGKVCTQFISFFLLPLYTALLTPDEYGVVDLLNTYIILLVPLINWQFEQGLFRYLLDCRNDSGMQRELFSTVMITNIFQVIIYYILFNLLLVFVDINYSYFLIFDVICSIILNTYLQYSRGVGNNIDYSIASFLSAASTIVFNVIFLVALKMKVDGMFLAMILSKIIGICYLFIKLKTWNIFSIRLFKKNHFKKILRYSLPLVPNQLSWWIVGISDRTIVSYVLGIFQNGIYSVANKFPSIIVTFYNILNLSWSETVALHFNDEDGEEFLNDSMNKVFVFFSSLCLGCIACIPLVFNILIDQQYNQSYFQIPILLLGVLFQIIVGLYSAIYIALKKTVEITKTSTLAAIINIIVNLLLINFIGLYAASISTFVAYFVLTIYRYIDVNKILNLKIEFKTIIITIFTSIIIIFLYYVNNIYLNILSLIIAVLYALYNNVYIIKIVFKKLINHLN